MSEKIKVLFLSANPASTGLLRLDEEAREIRESIARSEYRDSFELILQGVVGPTDLQETLLRYQPQIVHFSGFGSKEQGNILEDSFGHSKLLSKVALAELFKILKDSIRIVVLNACYSQPQAEELTEIIDYTIGISNVIEDKSAILFSASFYQALAYGRSVKEALAQINLELLDKSGSGKPVLLMRSGVADVPLVIPKETTVRGEILPPLRDVPLEPLLTRMQIEVCSSAVKPHQSGLLQTRQGRYWVTRQKPFLAIRSCWVKVMILRWVL